MSGDEEKRHSLDLLSLIDEAFKVEWTMMLEDRYPVSNADVFLT
jgi:hypothetical protein